MRPISAAAISQPPAQNRSAFVIEKAKAGIDYPTDAPARSFNVWVVGGQRINIGQVQQITQARAGVDFPTDGPANLKRDFSVFVTPTKRIAASSRISVQPAVAGIDYPTDAPPQRFSVLTWTNASGEPQRVPLSSVTAIRKARAGVDFPELSSSRNGPGPDLRRDFMVVVTSDGRRLAM